MNGHKEHIIHYSAADIQRYVQGKMSAREMHAMEKAALDDPFLADAIEGMQEAFTTHNENLVTGQLQQLQQQFQSRTSSAKVVAFTPFRYWQVAAAVVVIIAGVWIYSLIADSTAEKNSAPVIAKTEEKKIPQSAQAPALADSIEKLPDTHSTPEKSIVTNKTVAPAHGYNNRHENEQVLTKTNKAEAIPAAPEPSANQAALSRKAKAETATITDKSIAQEDAEKDKNIAAKQATASPVASAAVPELKKRKESTYNNANLYRDRETELITIPRKDSPKKNPGFNNNLSGVIKGQVTDQNNNPIANAYVQITKENNNILTDKTGFFKLPVSDSVVDVAVNVTGYGTQNFRLQNNTGVNQLQLQPANAALNEVAVIASTYNKSGIGSKLPNNIIHDAEPVGGWIAFDQYLEKNKKVPAGNTAAAGQVIVSFEVNKKGTLSNFKIEQSLSKACDDEAIRLITQGPAWKMLKKGRKARVTVMVRF